MEGGRGRRRGRMEREGRGSKEEEEGWVGRESAVNVKYQGEGRDMAFPRLLLMVCEPKCSG